MIEIASKFTLGEKAVMAAGIVATALYAHSGSDTLKNLVSKQFRPQEIAAPVQNRADCSKPFLPVGYELTCVLDRNYLSDKV